MIELTTTKGTTKTEVIQRRNQQLRPRKLHPVLSNQRTCRGCNTKKKKKSNLPQKHGNNMAGPLCI